MLLYYIKKILKTRFFNFGLLFCIISSLFIFLTSQNVYSVDVTLTWAANTEADLAGYRVYSHNVNQEDYNYNEPLWEGTVTTYTITDLDPDTTYYFLARAYDVLNNESSNSNEVIFSNGIIYETTDSGKNVVGQCFITTGSKVTKKREVSRVLRNFFFNFITFTSSP